MEEKKIVSSIDIALIEVGNYAKKYSLENTSDFTDILRVLNLLKEEFLKSENTNINERVLRAFKDICTLVSIQYEHTQFNDPIFIIYGKLEELLPSFKELNLLRDDFGKGNPI